MVTRPVPAFLIFNGAMWLWHIPGPYDAALAYPLLHVAEHLVFMGAALIGWWPIVSKRSVGAPELSRPGRVLYLFASALPCTALSALITLSPVPLYPYYGIMPLFWGLPPMLDQQIGGVIMWLPTDVIFAAIAAHTLYRWLGEPPERPGLQEV
jgi:cytochrome c oxidase assembly factor CtaG